MIRNAKVLVIFPAKNVKEADREKVINLKLKDYFKEEDHGWAKDFITNMMSKENFMEMKKAIGKMGLSDFIKFHDFFEKIINKNNNVDAIEHAVSCIEKYNQICSKIIDKVSFDYNFDAYEKHLSILKEDLYSEDSRFLGNLLSEIESKIDFNEDELLLHKLILQSSKVDLIKKFESINAKMQLKKAYYEKRDIMEYSRNSFLKLVKEDKTKKRGYTRW